MKRFLEGLLYLVGWLLSPLTLWNDAFINIPLSYFLAKWARPFLRLPFNYLAIGAYWLTNAVGLVFMYFGGRGLVMSFKDKVKATFYLVAFTLVYSALLIYLDKRYPRF